MTRKQSIVDVWTPNHVLVGAISRRIGLSPGPALGLWLAFEVVENLIASTAEAKKHIPSSGPESATNIVGDLLANAAGYALMDWQMRR